MQFLISLVLTFFVSLCAQAAFTEAVTGADVITGKEQQLQFSTAKKATVLVFLSAKCPCSDSHIEILRKLSDDFKDFQFVGVHSNADETADITKTYFQEKKLPFPVLQDHKSVLANRFGALKTPHVFVVDKKGELLYHGGVTDSHVGPSAKKNFLKDVLEDVQAGKVPRHKEGRALGCYIQREDEA